MSKTKTRVRIGIIEEFYHSIKGKAIHSISEKQPMTRVVIKENKTVYVAEYSMNLESPSGNNSAKTNQLVRHLQEISND